MDIFKHCKWVMYLLHLTIDMQLSSELYHENTLERRGAFNGGFWSRFLQNWKLCRSFYFFHQAKGVNFKNICLPIIVTYTLIVSFRHFCVINCCRKCCKLTYAQIFRKQEMKYARYETRESCTRSFDCKN